MAIAHRATDAATYSQNTFSPTINAAQLTGDMMILIAGGKSHTIEDWTMTAGWTALASGQSGTVGAGTDTGSMVMQVWYKEATSDTEANPTLTEVTAWNVAGAFVMVFSKAAGEIWVPPTVVYGADTAIGTAISATMSADNSLAANDHVICACAINTDAMGPLTTDLSASQAGVTFGSFTARQETETITGGDMSLHATEAAVTAGPSSAAAVLSGTGTASGGADEVQAAYIRLRVALAASLLLPNPYRDSAYTRM